MMIADENGQMKKFEKEKLRQYYYMGINLDDYSKILTFRFCCIYRRFAQASLNPQPLKPH